MAALSREEWRGVLLAAADDLAVTTLGYESGEVISNGSVLPKMPFGSFVALTGETISVQIGLAAARPACLQLARAMLCMEPDEELDDEDLTDVLGEMVNVVAGGTKSRLADRVEPMRIGLPIVVHGSVDATKVAEVDVTGIRWGDAEVRLILLRNEQGT